MVDWWVGRRQAGGDGRPRSSGPNGQVDDGGGDDAGQYGCTSKLHGNVHINSTIKLSIAELTNEFVQSLSTVSTQQLVERLERRSNMM